MSHGSQKQGKSGHRARTQRGWKQKEPCGRAKRQAPKMAVPAKQRSNKAA